VFTLTSSFAAQTASFTAFTSSILSYTASQNILNGTYTLTSSFAAQTASFTAFTASILAQTASLNSFSASVLSYTSSLNAKTSSFATTGSNTFEGIQTINSNLIVTGSITAQTLVVQTITSSVDFVTGSTRFGSLLANTHVFSGSVSMNPGGLFVSSSNNVGIGTTTPTRNLEIIAGASNNSILKLNATTANGYGAQVEYSSKTTEGVTTTWVVGTGVSTGTNSFEFFNGSSTVMFISSSGNIGIGTLNPIAALHIYSANQNVASSLATAYSNSKFRLETYNTSGQGISMGSIGGYSQYIQAQYSDQTTQAPLLLQPFSGSVGIGTSDTPTTPLLVYSNIASTSNVISEFFNGDYTAGTRNFIRVRNGVTVGATQSSYFGQGQDGKTYIISNDFTKNNIVINSANNNVGIGTNNPAKPLHVYNTNTSANAQFKLTNSGNTPSGYLGIFSDTLYINSGGTYDSGWTLDGAFGIAAIELYSFNGGSQLNFSTAASNTTPTERMRITSAGKVGIQNSSPQGRLEVGIVNNNTTAGGHFFSSFQIPVNTWYTVFNAPSNGQWNAITEFTWTSAGDFNRSGAAYMRWAYEAGAATLGVVYTLFNNSQNATATFRKSGVEIQIYITGGAADYYVQVRIQGSQAS